MLALTPRPCDSQEQDGVVIIRQAVTQEQVAQLRESLEQVFSRTDPQASVAHSWHFRAKSFDLEVTP